MNFLAHCLIGAQAIDGRQDSALIAGGFLGDFIKGRIPVDMPAPLARGVRLHRRVDAYSNQHPEIRQSCDRFPAELRRIAPILVDIICDHLLAMRWSDFHDASLKSFTAEAYAEVAVHSAWLPESGHRFLNYASGRDLFARYDDWIVICAAMRSITRRLARSELDPLLEVSIPPLLGALEADFLRYFPDILDHASAWVAVESRS